MTEHFPRSAPWTRLVRSLRPTYGARRNAAEGMEDLRLTRSDRAQAAAAFRASSAGVPERRRTSGHVW